MANVCSWVVSGPFGQEQIHFEAPSADRLAMEMQNFLNWINQNNHIDPVIKAGVAHFWFITIHPFEDGNGRIASAIADMYLALADNMPERFYSMSTSIEHNRKAYYQILESCQRGGADITRWLEWFLACLSLAIENTDEIVASVLRKSKIWERLQGYTINERQRKVINLLHKDFRGKLTTSKYAKLTKCSQDTALRDIRLLIDYKILVQSPGGGRSTSYELIVD